MEISNRGFVYANGIHVSGPDFFPPSAILSNLALTDLDLIGLSGKRAVSVGEGYSPLLDILLKNGANAHAVDIWYHAPEFPRGYFGKVMRNYVAQFKDRLIQGSALQLPITDQSVDLYLSHQLVNSFSIEEQIQTIREAVRVLASNGEARIYGFSRDSVTKIQKYLNENYPHLLFTGEQIITDFHHHYAEYGRGNNARTQSWLIRIFKP